LISIFAFLSFLLSLYSIFVNSRDVYDSSSVTFQMLNLSEPQIYLIDAVFIISHISLIVLMSIGWIRHNIRTVIIAALLISSLFFLQYFIEGIFRFPPV
jgi:hypothetical protein